MGSGPFYKPIPLQHQPVSVRTNPVEATCPVECPVLTATFPEGVHCLGDRKACYSGTKHKSTPRGKGGEPLILKINTNIEPLKVTNETRWS